MALRAISLFAGAGGDTLGLEQAGLKVVAFSENNKDARDTHLTRFPDSVWLGSSVKGDITKIPDAEFEAYRGTIEVLFAGFPCQGFSHAGKKDAADPRNRLFYEFLRVAQLVQPRIVMGENVAGLLSRKTDAGDGLIIDVIRREFSEIGYELATKVYDVRDVGVPQTRKRTILVGIRNSPPPVLPDFSIPPGGLRHFIEPTLENATPTNLVPPPENVFVLDKELSPSGTPHPYLLRKLADGELSYGKRDSATHSEILNLDMPSKTIICAYSFQPRLFVCLRTPSGSHYLRCLTVSELAQIQGFPAGYQFSGKLESRIKQIGNAVPPPLVSSITRSLVSGSSP